MIVRDEEKMLGACLESVRGLADEMIVLDTGSRDATARIAQDHGARVYDFVWCDDFAAARNAALDHAEGDWILQLDADERLTPRSGSRIRHAVANANFDCGMIRIHDALSADASFDEVLSGARRLANAQLVARLLRRTGDLRYVDAIHENVLPWIRKRGSRLSGIDADIIHLGATQEILSEKNKIERNVRLLRSRLEREPTDLVAYGYLSHEHLRGGDRQAAFEVMERGWAHAGTAVERKVSIHRLAVARAYLLIPIGRFAEVREALALAQNIDGENPDFTYLEGYSWEVEARYRTGEVRTKALVTARDAYRHCLTYADRVFASAFIRAGSTWSAEIRLGTMELLLGNAGQALEAFESALAQRGDEREAQLGRAEALIALGDPARALRLIESILGRSPDAWTLAAVAVDALGRREDCSLFARKARSLAREGFIAPHRRERLVHVVGHP